MQIRIFLHNGKDSIFKKFKSTSSFLDSEKYLTFKINF